MNEIYHNGPVVMNFEPTMEFMYYSKGVYHSKDSDWVSKPEWVIKNTFIFQ
jgi:cathepsin C